MTTSVLSPLPPAKAEPVKQFHASNIATTHRFRSPDIHIDQSDFSIWNASDVTGWLPGRVLTSGVWPSSATAIHAEAKNFRSSESILIAVVAAPEDGRTPKAFQSNDAQS